VFRVNTGEYEIFDCYTQSRKAERQIEPLMTFKNGKRFDVNMTLAQEENNWFLQIAEDHVPARAAKLSEPQLSFLDSLAAALASSSWEVSSAERLDIEKALELQDIFHQLRARHGLPLKDALQAVYASFLDQSFTMQIGLLLVRLDQPFAISRLRDVSRKHPIAA
jgi:dihydroorotase